MKNTNIFLILFENGCPIFLTSDSIYVKVNDFQLVNTKLQQTQLLFLFLRKTSKLNKAQLKQCHVQRHNVQMNNKDIICFFYCTTSGLPLLREFPCTIGPDCLEMTTILMQIERLRSNFRTEIFGAVAFKFEPNMTVVIKQLTQKVDFWSKICQVPL